MLDIFLFLILENLIRPCILFNGLYLFEQKCLCVNMVFPMIFTTGHKWF